MKSMKFLYGIDVGTGSVRVGLFNKDGVLLQECKSNILTQNLPSSGYLQSSENIWKSLQECLKQIQVVDFTNFDSVDICVGCDATCSLVVLDKDYQPVSLLSNQQNNEIEQDSNKSCLWNIMLWCDHQAIKQAEQINNTKHPCLQYVGGSVSPEMSIAKLLYIKQKVPEAWSKAEHFMELPDYLTFKFSGSLIRSKCSVTCKWLLVGDRNMKVAWDSDFLELIGLGDLAENDFSKIGKPSEIRLPGSSCSVLDKSKLLTDLQLADKVNVDKIHQVSVATSLIDAHCGVLGALTYKTGNTDIDTVPVDQKMVMVAGTSTCHMMQLHKKYMVGGVWGPYYDVILSDMFSFEAGQSAAGKLIDTLITSHPAYINNNANLTNVPMSSVYGILEEELHKLCKEKCLSSVHYLTSSYHLYPDYHGNRSPIGDPHITGMLCGLTLSNISDLQGLAVHYLATIHALAYSSLHIINVLHDETGGECSVKLILMCGGLADHKLYVQTHADVTGRHIVCAASGGVQGEDSGTAVLRGAAILGDTSSHTDKSLHEVVDMFKSSGELFTPSQDAELLEYHGKKYQVYREMLNDQCKYRETMLL